ncbi:MAG TPA: type II secretion system protein [Candidatus Acidoferrum sp.]|nr:type II secretion system protein [Candidatus Acidoferrum sp.]
MLLAVLNNARRRSHRSQGGFTLVELLVVIAILGVLAAIVLFNISGVNASAACNGMKTDGATIQGAADLYYNLYGVYPAGTATPATLPGAGDLVNPGGAAVQPQFVNQQELIMANLLHSTTAGWTAPANGQERFVYKTAPQGTVTGTIVGNANCAAYNP